MSKLDGITLWSGKQRIPGTYLYTLKSFELKYNSLI